MGFEPVDGASRWYLGCVAIIYYHDPRMKYMPHEAFSNWSLSDHYNIQLNLQMPRIRSNQTPLLFYFSQLAGWTCPCRLWLSGPFCTYWVGGTCIGFCCLRANSSFSFGLELANPMQAQGQITLIWLMIKFWSFKYLFRYSTYFPCTEPRQYFYDDSHVPWESAHVRLNSLPFVFFEKWMK